MTISRRNEHLLRPLRVAAGFGGLSVFFAIACSPPGEGPKALCGFKSSSGIIQALGDYRAKAGTYPTTLDALTPAFLTDHELRPPEGISRYDYFANDDGFKLTFNYVGPGLNTCSFESKSRSWTCWGRF